MKTIFNSLKKLIPGEFSKHVFTLLTGSTIAQLIPIFVAPILSRIFTPGEFGVLAVYVSVVQILGSVATGRYEFALVIPKDKKDAIHIFVLGLSLVFILSTLSFITILFLKKQLVSWFDIADISKWLYLIPISTFLIGLFNLLNYYNTRLEAYKTIATSSIVKSFSKSTVQLGSGLLNFGVTGLISGEIASMIFGNYSLGKKVKNDVSSVNISVPHIKKVAKKYKRFPLISMWAVFFNVASQNISQIFIAMLFTVSQTGFYSHAIRYISLPINMIGKSINQVLFNQASKARQQKGNATKEYFAVLKKLTIIAIPSFILLYFVIEDVFAWYFGENWRVAGIYTKILLPYLMLRFIASPLSILNMAFEKQFIGLYIQLSLFLISISLFLVVKRMGLGITDYLHLISIGYSIFYFIVIILMYFVAKGKLQTKYF